MMFAPPAAPSTRSASAWLLAVFLLLVGCSTGRSKAENPSCELIGAKVVEGRFGISNVAVKVNGSSCAFSEKGEKSPFLVISRSELDGTPLGALVVGDVVPGYGDEAVASEHGGPLGTAAVVRSGNTAIRVDVMPAGKVTSAGLRDLALGLAGSIVRRSKANGSTTSTTPGRTTICDRLQSHEATAGGSMVRYRPINASTCEARIDGSAGSVYLSAVVDAGATPEDLERSAGAGAVSVDVGDAARWVPTSDGRGGSLWVLQGGRLFQANATDVPDGDRGQGLAVDFVRALIAAEGAD